MFFHEQFLIDLVAEQCGFLASLDLSDLESKVNFSRIELCPAIANTVEPAMANTVEISTLQYEKSIFLGEFFS